MSDLGLRIRRLPPRLLLPHAGAESEAPDRLQLVDALALPASGPSLMLALLQDPDERRHVVVLAKEGEVVRPARAGDRVGRALALTLATAPVHDPFQVRRRGEPGPLPLEGPWTSLTAQDAPEDVMATLGGRELIALGDEWLVVLERSPTRVVDTPPDVIEHCRTLGFPFGAEDHGDLVHSDVEWVGPLVTMQRRVAGSVPLVEELLGALLDTARGQDTDRAVALATASGTALARWHVALATATPVLREPVQPASSELLGQWRRDAADAVAAAAVLAESGSVQRLRGGRERLRDAFAAVDTALGTTVLMGGPLLSPDAFTVHPDARVLLLPYHVVPSLVGHSAAQDVAVLLRGVAHVAWATHRRLVLADQMLPVEQIADWENAMREIILTAYLETLEANARRALFDDDLLTAFEIQVECQTLVRSVRTLSAGTVVSDTALAALLGQ